MAESKAAWDQVGEDFKALGRQVKQHYDQRPPTQAPRRGPSADRRKVDEALEARSRWSRRSAPSATPSGTRRSGADQEAPGR